MKYIKRYTILIAALAIIPVACSKDFLETRPLDKVSSDATWADGALSEAFVFGVYSHLNYGGFEEEGLSSLTDEAMFTHSGRGINVINEGTLSPTGTGNVNIIPQWDELFSAIRQANIAIAELPEATFGDDELKNRLLGESYFLRAYYYHQVVRYYGGSPIIDKPYGLDEEYSIARGTYEECVNFILSDLDQAITLLTDKGATPGRASDLSAMGLKSRVLLYAASDLRDGPTVSSASSAHGGYSNLELVAYTSGDRASRWNAAKQASKALLDATTGYKLDLAAPVSPEEGEANYLALSMGGVVQLPTPPVMTIFFLSEPIVPCIL